MIDITADGAGYDIVATGSDWEIRNVGFRGKSYQTRFNARVPDPNGSAVIENVFISGNPGTSTIESDGDSGIYIYPDHAGDLLIRNCWIQDCNDNGIYGSATGNPDADEMREPRDDGRYTDGHPWVGDRGAVRVENVYAIDNHTANIRLGTDSSYAENCVMVGGYQRGYWGFYWNTELRNCDILGASSADVQAGSGWKSGATVTVENTRFNEGYLSNDFNEIIGESAGEPRDRVPDGVPTSPEEAASGESGSSDPARPPEPSIEDVWREDEANHIVLSGGSGGDVAAYRIEGEGTAEYGDDANTRSDDEYRETITADGDEFEIEGYLGGGGSDDFHVEGAITGVDADSGVSATLNGTEFDPHELAGIGSWESDFGNVILVDGTGTSSTTQYEFAVSGAVEPSTDSGASIDDEDTIDSGRVTGSVAGWRDAFRFEGELEELTVDGPAEISVNGDPVDPTEYGDSLPHVLTLVGNGSDASYEVSVEGTIEPDSSTDTAEYATQVDERTIEGAIERGVQQFQFSGTLAEIAFSDGSAHVYLDDERIDPDEYGDQELLPNAIVIDGTGVDGETTYSFTVDGEVITSSYRDASIDSDDSIDDQSVSGSVDDSLDAYWFDGNIVDFQLAGNASVDVEYGVHDR